MRFLKLVPSAVAIWSAAGCAGVQSALDPHGPHAADIASLTWLLFAVGAIVISIVVAAIWLAIRSGPKLRARLASERVPMSGSGPVMQRSEE